MIRFLTLTIVLSFLTLCPLFAQDFTKKGLMEIKEQSETKRMEWNTAFDDAVQSKNFSRLTASRQAVETYLDQQLTALRRQYAQGDGRSLLTSVNNYLQIQKQFVKDVMIAAEGLTADNQEGINKINQKINDFAQKEKIFLIEINNALATEPDIDPGQATPEPEEPDEEQEEIRGSVVEERPNSGRGGKLPHEKGKKGKKDRDQEDED